MGKTVEMMRRFISLVSRYDNLFKQFIEEVVRKYPDSTIILFDSRSSGKNRPSSDFDVAVIMEGVDEFEMATRISKLRPRGLPIDLVVLKPESLRRFKWLLKGAIVYDGLKLECQRNFKK